jgi:hypothetical protein
MVRIHLPPAESQCEPDFLHTHAKSAFIYATVLEGAIRSQVNDGPVTTYKAGLSFSELPGDRHGVSAVGSTLMFAGGNAVVKWQLATYPLGEVAFGRTLFAFLTVAAITESPRSGGRARCHWHRPRQWCRSTTFRWYGQ